MVNWFLLCRTELSPRLPLLSQIFLPRPGVAGDMNKTVELAEDTKAVSAINVSDPDATIFFSVEPSINVQLVLMLAYSSPPNSSYFSNTTVLGQEGTRTQVSRDLRLISMHAYKYTSYKYTHLCRLTGCLGVQ